jgi:hypothetical protein
MKQAQNGKKVQKQAPNVRCPKAYFEGVEEERTSYCEDQSVRGAEV